MNGQKVIYSQQVHVIFWCPMRFNTFPLDTQVCQFKVDLSLILSNYTFNRNVLLYKYEMASIQIKITRMTTSITLEVLVKQGLTKRLSESS